MNNLTIISDSSFYICFCDDIKKPNYLIRLFKYKPFFFIMGPIIKQEIEKSPNFKKIEKIVRTYVNLIETYNYGEILRPFLSLEEMEKGEGEVIALSFHLLNSGIEFIVIIDEEKIKKFLQKHFSILLNKVTGTLGFIRICCCDYRIFSKKEATKIIDLIKNSKFRVKINIIDEVIKSIKEC